ncbi:outer membrane beta-barrel protein [Bacterioplanoides sp.]|uniref:outer membrane beta-barrel protein n=1 Tax=Bacterioplanoides sp. TaxID=2066072 RepID=UPI003B591D2C
MKPALPLLSLLISLSTMAQADQSTNHQLKFGIAYKHINAAVPHQSDVSRIDKSNDFPAVAIAVSDRVSPYFSTHLELATGIKNQTSDYENEKDKTAQYAAKLAYSLSALAKVRPLGNKTLTPLLILGLNTAEFKYNFQSSKERTGKITSSGFVYGAGLELKVASDLDLSLTYENIAHFHEDVSAVSLEANIYF